MHALAFAAKCAGFGASGEPGASARGGSARAKNPSLARRYVSAVPTKPPPICQRNSRRVRPQKSDQVPIPLPPEVRRRDSLPLESPPLYLVSILNLCAL